MTIFQNFIRLICIYFVILNYQINNQHALIQNHLFFIQFILILSLLKSQSSKINYENQLIYHFQSIL